MKRSLAVLAACVLALMLVSACTQGALPSPSPPPTPTPVPNPTPETPPAATPSPDPEPAVPPAFAAELDANFWERVDGSTATIPLTAALHEFLGGGGAAPAHETTPYAYRNLFDYGGADLIFVTAPSEEELSAAELRGVELEVIPIVKDALVFLANTANPVDGVSLAQLRDIYAGKITGWKALGGLDADIIPYQRTPNSGSQTLFTQLVMDGRAPMEPPSEWVAESMGSLVEVVSGYDNARDALGYSMFYYVNNMYGNSQFKLLAVDGVKPSRDTITRGAYPLEDYYYAVIRKDTPQDSLQRKLVDWLLTAGGQTLAVRAGYIPLQPLENVFPDETVDPIYLGDVDHSSGTGGTTPKPGIDDVEVNGVRKPLSDIFYDGFNYIAYLNGEITDWLNSYVSASVYSEWVDAPPLAEHVARPFTGIPNDYPHYELSHDWSGENVYLTISFPEGNPFFSRAISFRTRLTPDISPYGTAYGNDHGLSVAYRYDRRLLPRIDLFTMSVSLNSPAAAERVNRQLQAWTDGFPGGGDNQAFLEDFIKWYTLYWDEQELAAHDFAYQFQPSYGQWQNYLSVSYQLQTYDGPSSYMPVLYTICFDMDTGEQVDFVGLLPADISYANSMITGPITKFEAGTYPPYDYYLEYTPAQGSVVTAAWIVNDTLGLRLTEPDGRELQISMGIADLKA